LERAVADGARAVDLMHVRLAELAEQIDGAVVEALDRGEHGGGRLLRGGHGGGNGGGSGGGGSGGSGRRGGRRGGAGRGGGGRGGAACRPDHALDLHLLDDLGGAVVPDVEPALDHAGADLAGLGDDLHRLVVERVGAAIGGLVLEVLLALGRDLVVVDRARLLL